MIRNFFTIAIRNLFKHKVFSFINIFGLAIGIAASLLILQYVRFELSYDRFEANAGRIYRMQQNRYDNGRLSTQWAAGAAGIGPQPLDVHPAGPAHPAGRDHDDQHPNGKSGLGQPREEPAHGVRRRVGHLLILQTTI
jgi:hypothetical protein